MCKLNDDCRKCQVLLEAGRSYEMGKVYTYKTLDCMNGALHEHRFHFKASWFREHCMTANYHGTVLLGIWIKMHVPVLVFLLQTFPQKLFLEIANRQICSGRFKTPFCHKQKANVTRTSNKLINSILLLGVTCSLFYLFTRYVIGT